MLANGTDVAGGELNLVEMVELLVVVVVVDGTTNPLMSGAGGSGIVVVRYQIGLITSPTKATGGAISFYGGKTIHTFTRFWHKYIWFSLTVDHIIVGGGGGGCWRWWWWRWCWWSKN